MEQNIVQCAEMWYTIKNDNRGGIIMNTEHRQQKISFWHSMKTQFIAVVLLVAAVIVTLYTVMIMPGVKSNIRSIYSNYLLDLSISYGREMEDAMASNANLLSSTDDVQNILQQVQIEGAKTAYAYLVDFNGTMLYHPTAEKIGQPVENEAVKKMLTEIQKGNIPKPETVQYVFQGAKKFAACYTSENQFILVVTADDTELLAPAVALEKRGILISVVLLLIGAVAALLFATRITRPLSQITKSVNRIAELDLRRDDVLDQCASHQGEVGIIANAVIQMKDALAEIVQKMRQQGQQLFTASETLNRNAAKTAGNVNNVETAVNEIATSATSQAQETQGATEDIISMGTMIEDSSTQVKTMNDTADVMNESGQIAKKALEELGEINQKATESINIIYEQTNTTNDSALKIKDATSLIASIADETNLLSLNASIEAARAGEAGKGFAVVAAQIQKLAEQSNESAKQIDEIIHELLKDSENAVHTMEDVKKIMQEQNEKVTQTAEVFAKMHEGVDVSIRGMASIEEQTQKIEDARNKIVDTVQSLSAIAEENAASTQETSASMMEIGSVISDISQNAENLKNIAEVLDQSVKQFKMEDGC